MTLNLNSHSHFPQGIVGATKGGAMKVLPCFLGCGSLASTYLRPLHALLYPVSPARLFFSNLKGKEYEAVESPHLLSNITFTLR